MDTATWASLIVAGAAIIAIIKFWMDVGASRQELKEAKTIASTASAKCDLVAAQLNEFKTYVATEFVATQELTDAENRLAAAVEGIRNDFRNFTERFDKLLMEMTRSNRA